VVLCDPSDDIDSFNNVMEDQGLPTLQKYIPIDVDQKTFDDVCRSEWLMPKEYKAIDVDDWVLRKLMKIRKATHTDQILYLKEWDRVYEELKAFDNRGMFDLLRYMIYLVDYMRENNIVWGVGRGSSVSSYVLYLIGVHKIDSIKYNLDWREFLRD
jgi:DNA polymerase III alpha subunit